MAPGPGHAGPLVLHASTVALDGRALLIRGRSGSGKSGLALELMAHGATLVADDRTVVTREGAGLQVSAPQAIRGLIEARGLGLLRAATVETARLAAVLDLDVAETMRLPEIRHTRLLCIPVPLLHNFAHQHFAAGLIQYLRGGRQE